MFLEWCHNMKLGKYFNYFVPFVLCYFSNCPKGFLCFFFELSLINDTQMYK